MDANLQLTYTESLEIKPIDWHLIIGRGMDDELTQHEHDMACELAGAWVTCACGKQCAVLPREDNGQPTDHHLLSMGTDFYYNVLGYEWADALMILEAIEKRSAYLLTLPDYREHIYH